jgi:hypothetical protein
MNANRSDAMMGVILSSHGYVVARETMRGGFHLPGWFARSAALSASRRSAR